MTQGGNGNCTAQDDKKILDNIEDQCFINNVQTGNTDVQIAREYDLILRAPLATYHDYCDISNEVMLTEYKEAVLSYVAGFVARIVKKSIVSPECVTALITDELNVSIFVSWKSNSELTILSKSVIKRH